MNNANARVYLQFKSKHKPHTPGWQNGLREQVVLRLKEMQREFSQNEFGQALKAMKGSQLSLAGVTFLLSLV